MSNKYARSRTPSTQTFHKSSVAKAISTAIITSMISLPLFAEEVEEEEIEVIMVTATKKSETLQEVPLAVTALTGDFMEKVHLTNVKDIIAYSPGVNGNANSSFLDSVSVRGVRTDDYGAGGDGSLAFFKNDQYEGRAGAAVSTLFDMDRAEIVNGPQGFLFGRNAIGGAVSVHTKRAEIDLFDANINVDAGEYGLFKLDGAVNIPVNDNFAMRLAGLYNTEEAYSDNVVKEVPLQDTEITAARWSTTFVKDDLSIFTMVDYEDRVAPGGMYHLVDEGEIWEEFDALWGIGSRAGERDVDMNAHWGLKDEAELLNLQIRVEQKFDFADLTLNLGRKDYDYYYSEQWIPTGLPTGSWAVDQEGDYTQAELRLSSNGDGPLSWYVGTSMYEENLDFDTYNGTSDEFMCAYYNASWGMPALSESPTGHCQNFHDNLVYYAEYYGYPSDYYTSYYNDLPNANGQVVEVSYIEAYNEGWAAFASLGYQITDTLDVEFGVRYTDDTKEFANNMTGTGFSGGWAYGNSNTTAEPIVAKDSWDDTTYKYLIRWKPTDTAMLYASYTEGFKSGGFSSATLDGVGWGEHDVTNANAQIPSFEPEFVESYELGYKDTWFADTDVRFTAYMYDYFGLQVNQRADEGGGVVVKNSGKVEAIGLEAASNTSLTDNFTLMMNFHYIDSEASGIQEQCTSGDTPAGPSFDGDDGYEDCEGSRLYWTPEFSGAAVLNGNFPLDSGAAITTSLETHFESEYYGDYTFNNDAKIDASQTWNARIGYDSGNEWYVEAYVDNLTDELNYDSSYVGDHGAGGGGGAYPAVRWAVWKSRSFGVRFGMSWN